VYREAKFPEFVHLISGQQPLVGSKQFFILNVIKKSKTHKC
jgi:hypothetical protein